MPDQKLRKGKTLKGKDVFKALATLSCFPNWIKQLKTTPQVLVDPEAKGKSLLPGFQV